MSSPYTTHEYAGQPLYLSLVTPYFFIALQISCFPIDQFWLNEIPARRHLRQRKRMLTFPCDLRGTTFLPTVDIRAAISETCLKALQAPKPHCTPQEPTPFTISCTYTQEEPWETFRQQQMTQSFGFTTRLSTASSKSGSASTKRMLPCYQRWEHQSATTEGTR